MTLTNLKESGKTWIEIGELLGISANAARCKWQRDPELDVGEFDMDWGGVRVRTLEDLIASCNVDLTKYDVRDFRVNTWEMGAVLEEDGKKVIVTEPLHQVRANLIPKVSHQAEFLKNLIEDAKSHAPVYPNYVRAESCGRLLEISVCDLHAGKYAWKDETGEDYDSDIAVERFRNAVDDLLSRAKDVDKILFVVGNDLMHVDSPNNQTFNGTPLDVDTRFQRTYRMVMKMLVEAVDKCLSIAPVDVMVVPGNHDRTATWTLGEALDCWYSKCDEVTVRNDSCPNKYYRWGRVLLGFHHGDIKHERLPLMMAQDVPHLWSETDYREIHVGHYHKNKSLNWVGTDETTGVVLRTLPSLSGTDAWHRQQGFTGNQKQALGFVWDKDSGLRSIEVHNAL